MLETVVSATNIETHLADIVRPLVTPLYKRFGVPHVAPTLSRARWGRFRSARL